MTRTETLILAKLFDEVQSEPHGKQTIMFRLRNTSSLVEGLGPFKVNYRIILTAEIKD